MTDRKAAFLCPATGVIHDARIFPPSERGSSVAATACGQRLIGFGPPKLDPQGEFTETYRDFCVERDGQAYVLCSHCRDREPIWEQWRRRARKKTKPKRGSHD